MNSYIFFKLLSTYGCHLIKLLFSTSPIAYISSVIHPAVPSKCCHHIYKPQTVFYQLFSGWDCHDKYHLFWRIQCVDTAPCQAKYSFSVSLITFSFLLQTLIKSCITPLSLIYSLLHSLLSREMKKILEHRRGKWFCRYPFAEVWLKIWWKWKL
jgi:hypothetical protein